MRLTIIGFPRSGSTYFCSLLRRIEPIRAYLEIFHFSQDVVIQHLDNDWEAVIDRLLKVNSGVPDWNHRKQPGEFVNALEEINCGKIVSYKIFPQHLNEAGLEACLEKGGAIFLYRNLVDAFISNEIALSSGRFANKDTSNIKIKFDRQRFVQFGRQVSSHYSASMRILERFGKSSVLITYEQMLAEGYGQELRESLSNEFGWELRPSEAVSPPWTKRQDSRSAPGEKVVNPDDLFLALSDLGFANQRGDIDFVDVKGLVRQLNAMFS